MISVYDISYIDLGGFGWFSALSQPRHTYSLRRDDLRALCWGKRFLSLQPKVYSAWLTALEGKPWLGAAFQR